MKNKGAVAAGHEETAEAAVRILEEGGNAFDAALAAHLVACVAEPVLASLGGGSFLIAHRPEQAALVYDFFVQTPSQRKTGSEIEFLPVSVDFGTTQQEFHIGMGAVAAPGVVRGLFAIHRDLCALPMRVLIEPAVELAKNGLQISPFQAYLLDLVKPILSFHEDTVAIFGSRLEATCMPQAGETQRLPEFADCLESLALEGEDLFYRGEIAQRIVELCNQHGGYLTRKDLENYQIVKRTPLETRYRGNLILTNPPPSSGGLLIAFALNLLAEVDSAKYAFGSGEHLRLLAEILGLTEKARLDRELESAQPEPDAELLDPETIRLYQQQVRFNPACSRGTTHISVADAEGNLASLTTSNGEGCGYTIPGTSVLLNNMLGEEDLNPRGFHRWPENVRMTSMMAPTLLFFPGGKQVALGSGGSNRLRTAILQVLINLIDFQMPLRDAVSKPRIHYESGKLNVEHGFERAQLKTFLTEFPNHKVWDATNLFFGGAHAVCNENGRLSGFGDPRRSGAAFVI